MEDQERLAKALADRYRIEREIGCGGMATVYLAHDLKHDRQVAVKVLDPELAQDLGAERFLREIATAANLTHPHILPLHDSGEADGFLFYVMPYVEGESLRSRLTRETQLPVEDAVQITREIADALAYAHERGVIHRDVKPANILLESGHAVLADFGVAHALTEAKGERLTRSGISLGTPAYMSPEQAAGEENLDGRSDQYGLGCVLYEMLAGRPPFSAPQIEGVLRQHLTADPVPIDKLRSTVPEEVAKGLARALEKNPADRFQTTSGFGSALAAPGPSTPASIVPIRSRSLSRVAAGVTVIAALFVAVLFFRDRSGTGEGGTIPGDAQRVMVVPYENQTGDPELDPFGRWVAEGITEALARTGEVQVVPNLMVLESLARVQAEEVGPAGQVPVRELAEATGSTIAVTGTIYRHGEDLEFHSEIVDLASGVPLGVVGAVRSATADPREAIATIQDRVLGVLATRLRSGTAWEVPGSVQPPTYEAFRNYARGTELWVQGRYSEAAVWYTRAYEADTSFLRSLMLAAASHGYSGNEQASDSLFQIILLRREELAPYDRYRLDYAIAGKKADLAGQLRAARAGVQLVPSGTLRLALVISLRSVNRPREALENLEDVLEDVRAIAPEWVPIWRIHTELLHLLGSHEHELAVARDGREVLPSSLHLLAYEGRALAALGSVEAVRGIVDEVLAVPGQRGTNVGRTLERLAMELQAHGHPMEASEVVQKALTWLDEQPPEFSAGPQSLELRGSLFYLIESWEEAGAVFETLAEQGVASSTILGSRGVVAARLGDTASAMEFSRKLADPGQPDPYGARTLWRARIEAVVGNREEATALFRRSHGEGVGFGIWLHLDKDLESLRGYPPFDEFVRPKG